MLASELCPLNEPRPATPRQAVGHPADARAPILALRAGGRIAGQGPDTPAAGSRAARWAAPDLHQLVPPSFFTFAHRQAGPVRPQGIAAAGGRDSQCGSASSWIR